jgi:hypothetical protein
MDPEGLTCITFFGVKSRPPFQLHYVLMKMESPLHYLILFTSNGVSIGLPDSFYYMHIAMESPFRRLLDSFFVMRARFQSNCKKNQALGKSLI